MFVWRRRDKRPKHRTQIERWVNKTTMASSSTLSSLPLQHSFTSNLNTSQFSNKTSRFLIFAQKKAKKTRKVSYSNIFYFFLCLSCDSICYLYWVFLLLLCEIRLYWRKILLMLERKENFLMWRLDFSEIICFLVAKLRLQLLICLSNVQLFISSNLTWDFRILIYISSRLLWISYQKQRHRTKHWHLGTSDCLRK